MNPSRPSTSTTPGFTMPSPNDSFERFLLSDADVRFGYENYKVLRRIGELMRHPRSENAETEPADANALVEDQGPTLLELVRLAHAAGKRLVIGLEETEGDSHGAQYVVRL